MATNSKTLPLTKNNAIDLLRHLCNLDKEFNTMLSHCIHDNMPFYVQDNFLYYFYSLSPKKKTPYPWSNDKGFIFYDLDKTLIDVIVFIDSITNLIIELEFLKPCGGEFELLQSPLEADIKVVDNQYREIPHPYE